MGIFNTSQIFCKELYPNYDDAEYTHSLALFYNSLLHE